MARVLSYAELAKLPKGTHVWEECIYGVCTCTPEIVVKRVRSFKGVFTVFGEYADEAGEIMLANEHDFRYWDAEPTYEERMRTSWSRSPGN